MSSETAVALRDLAIAWDGSREPLITDLSAPLPTGFTGVVGANGAGKTTLLKVVTGLLRPLSGSVQGASDAIYCEQRTDAAPVGLDDFLDDWDGAAFELRGRLGVAADALMRWDSLSHGERKRVQIAHALWRAPALLAIDEPTNHIDTAARDLLLASLQRFRGVGLIVSHDRDLLDALCVQCLWLEPPTATLYTGSFSEARERRSGERDTAVRTRGKAQREQRSLQREVAVRRERATREHSDRSKRGLGRKDADAREKIDRQRLTDGKGGQTLRQLHGRVDRANVRLEAARVTKEYVTGIWLPGSRSRRDTVLDIEGGALPLGTDRVLQFPHLVMRPDDRVAITGVNGAGKSTLVRYLLPRVDVPAEHLVVMPQEVSAGAAAEHLDAARALRNDMLGHVMNVVSRLGSRPQRLLDSRQPSPGEIRKLLLALGMACAPHLIVMDEPTNHLDLPSIEALQAALADCPCALMLVSHDQRLVEALARTVWDIQMDADGNCELVVHDSALRDA